MHSIINFVHNYVGKSDVHFHGNERFSNIFFDKFKNLLDDYIVNYQIKYFFYVLFISFFYLELSEGLFQLLHNYSPYQLSIFGSFIIDLCYSLSSLSIIDFMYSFFAFNLDSIGYFLAGISNYDYRFSYMPVAVIIVIFSYLIESSKNNILNARVMFFFYLVYSFIFFICFYLGIISLGFYVYFTLLLIISIFVLRESNMDKLDYLICFIILALSVSSYLFTSSLLLLIFIFICDKYDILIDRKSISIEHFSVSRFGDLLMVGVLTYFIVPLKILYLSTSLFALNYLAFGIYLMYIYKDVPIISEKKED
jgi:hypothetical protein